MSYKLIYSKVAKEDLHQIFDYIANDNLGKALEFTTGMQAEIQKLCDFPFAWRQGKLKGDTTTYRILIHKNYKAYYIVEDAFINIHHVIHAAKDN